VPFDLAGLSIVAAIDSSLLVVHSAALTIANIGARNLEPLAGPSSPSAAHH
jgi:hypothetical protein